MNQVGPAFVAVVTGVIGLAIVAVLVSQNAQTSGVISSGGGALAGIISAAVSPVTGSSSNTFGSVATSALGSMVGSTLV